MYSLWWPLFFLLVLHYASSIPHPRLMSGSGWFSLWGHYEGIWREQVYAFMFNKFNVTLSIYLLKKKKTYSLLKKKMYWSIVALQRCVSFCYTAKWIGFTYTYSPPFLDFLPILVPTELSEELTVLCGSFSWAIYFIYGINSVYTSAQPPSSSHTPLVSVFVLPVS